MDEGWTRLILDQFEFDYIRVSGDDVQAGSTRTDKIDVLVLADDARVTAGGGGRGGRGAGGAAAGAASGAGAAGAAAPAGPDPRVKAIDDFVRGGGTLVCFNRSSTFAIDQLKLPVKNVVAGVEPPAVLCGRVAADGASRRLRTASWPGMPERAAVYYDSGPVFETTEGFKGAVIARYPENETPLASGFLQGEKLIQGKAAALDVELGTGHVAPARLPSAVARPAVGHVSGHLQRDQK